MDKFLLFCLATKSCGMSFYVHEKLLYSDKLLFIRKMETLIQLSPFYQTKSSDYNVRLFTLQRRQYPYV